MSRNWTPREMIFVDLRMTKEGHSLRDSLNGLVFVDVSGNRVSFFSDEKKKVMSMFRELGFLFGDNLYHLWVATEKHPRIRKRVLMSVEQELENLITADINNQSLDCFDKTIVSWYMGELDPCFYYSEYNDELLENYLYEKIMK